MKARLAIVRRTLLILLASCGAVAAITAPRPGQRSLVAALTELGELRAEFVREAAEHQLASEAEAAHRTPLSLVQRAVGAQRGPKLNVAEAAPSVAPLSFVRLDTLDAIAAHSAKAVTVPVGTLDPDALGAALGWRLAQGQLPHGLTLESVELVAAQVSAEDAAREREVSELRLSSVAARTALERARDKLERATTRLEARKKRRARSIAEYQTIYDAVLASHDQKQRQLDELSLAYQEKSRAALERSAELASVRAIDGVPEVAVAKLVLSGSGERRVLNIPVQLRVQTVPVTPLHASRVDGTLPALHAVGLWNEVKGLDAAQAMSLVRARLHWHGSEARLLGLTLKGTLVLQVLPGLLPCLLVLLLLVLRRAAHGYSPFSTQLTTSLPDVGFSSRALELALLVLAPLLASACAAVALSWLGEPPILPALAGLTSVVLGFQAFGKLQDLRDLSVSIVQYHSYPPPADTLGSNTRRMAAVR